MNRTIPSNSVPSLRIRSRMKSEFRSHERYHLFDHNWSNGVMPLKRGWPGCEDDHDRDIMPLSKMFVPADTAISKHSTVEGRDGECERKRERASERASGRGRERGKEGGGERGAGEISQWSIHLFWNTCASYPQWKRHRTRRRQGPRRAARAADRPAAAGSQVHRGMADLE
jgi:hypothetical protein